MAAETEHSDLNPVVSDAAPRVRLSVHAGTSKGDRIDCRRVVTLIGSRDGCKVTLNHPKVAPVHVAIVNDGAKVVAVDLVTQRRALLNGLKLGHEYVNDGDLLTVVPWEFRIDLEQPTETGDGDLHPFPLEPSPRLMVLEHADSGRIMQPNRDVCIIGRRNGCDIVISDNRVSRVHALLLNYFGHPAIFDLLSRNHTLVNDLPVQFRVLEDGDQVTIGESNFRAKLMGSSVGEVGEASPPPPDVKMAVETTVALTAAEESEDLVDIQATETAQRWRIADLAEKVARRA